MTDVDKGVKKGGIMTSVATGEKTEQYKMYVDGEWVEAVSGGSFPSENPYTGEAWAQVPDASEADVDRAVFAARKAFKEGPWGKMTGTERARLMRNLADILARDAEELARCETLDNGKLLREMLAQMRYMPEWFYYFAGMADKIQGEVIPADRSNFFVYTRHEPVGVVAAIVPWNSPLLLMAWKLAPALAAGCTFVLKPSDYTPVSALEFAKRVEEAGFPPGVFNVVTGGPDAGRALVTHPRVGQVAFTGSTQVGTEIAKAASENITPVLLELGGKSANVVFDDADLGAAANGVIAGIFAATGQSCMAGSRLLVHEDVHDELVERVTERTKTIKLGDPMETETEMGPMATGPQLEKVLNYLDSAVDEGAEVAYGGGRDDDHGGLFVKPTVLTGVRNDMKVAREEIFGPVLSVIPFRNEDEAVEIANDAAFGLAAGVWTENVHRAHRVAHQLEAGTVWINAYRIVSFNAPFGGYKMSGAGRENGMEAVREFTETKSIWVELSGATRDPFTLG